MLTVVGISSAIAGARCTAKETKMKDKKTKETLIGVCKVCQECNGVNCVGLLPGMGGAGDGRSFRANFETLRQYSPVLSGVVATCDTSTEMFGIKVSMPIFNAPMTGMQENFGGHLSEQEYARCCALASKQSGTVFFSGDGVEEEKFLAGLAAARAVGVPFVSIIKPRSQKRIMKQIDMAQSMGALAVGVDVDSYGLINMTRNGEAVENKTKKQLEELVRFASVPFIVKGVLDVPSALDAIDIGASGIVVSNHGGRISPNSLSAWEVLPDIKKAVKNTGGGMLLLGDGGIRSGRDVFVALSLGVDFVLVGRPVLIGAARNKADGISTLLKQMGRELHLLMLRTACGSLDAINPKNIIKHNDT